jgi:hypothetical protein
MLTHKEWVNGGRHLPRAAAGQPGAPYRPPERPDESAIRAADLRARKAIEPVKERPLKMDGFLGDLSG